MARRPVLAGLDVGTQQVGLLVAERMGDSLEILGVGSAVSRGLRAGRVVDVEKTTEAISVALSEAELMAGCQIHDVMVTVSGDHVQGTNSHGVVPIDNAEVSARAARRVVESAQAVPLPNDQIVLHLLCREYLVDGVGGIRDPVGMSGVRLEANLHVVSACESSVGNLVKCCNKAGLSVSGLVAGSLASSRAVLEQDEMELGVAMLDIGAGTVDLAIYVGGSVVHSCVQGVAGLYITRDLARCLETSMGEAERLKKQHGNAVSWDVDRQNCVEVSGVGGRPPRIVSCRLVADIVQPRVEEIFESAAEAIVRSGYGDMLTSGIVLTGGTAMMPGMATLAERVFEMPVRLGEPTGIDGLADEIDDPTWAAALGLVSGRGDDDLATPFRPTVASRMVPQWMRRRWKEMF